MNLDEFLSSMCKMTMAEYVSEWGAERLPSFVSEGDVLRVYAYGAVIVEQAKGSWCVQLTEAHTYSTDQHGTTRRGLERLLWCAIRHERKHGRSVAGV